MRLEEEGVVPSIWESTYFLRFSGVRDHVKATPRRTGNVATTPSLFPLRPERGKDHDGTILWLGQ